MTDGKLPVLDLSGLSAEEAAMVIVKAASAAVGSPVDRTQRRITAALAACRDIGTEALEQAGRHAVKHDRLGHLKDLCEIERCIVSKEPRR